MGLAYCEESRQRFDRSSRRPGRSRAAPAFAAAHGRLTITDDDGIQELNRQFREIDRPTDVLSFPNVSYDEPGDFSVMDGEQKNDLLNPDTGNIMFGDIVVNENRVRSQAEEYGHSTKREFAFLIAHSMLHLCGYDHMEEDEAAVMEKKQSDVLNSLGITRD